MAAFSFLAALLAASLLAWSSHSLTLSSRLVHRFSDEARAAAASRGGGRWPARRSAEYYQVLARNDLLRQKRLLGPRYQTLFPSEGSETFNLGNDFGWCVEMPLLLVLFLFPFMGSSPFYELYCSRFF